MPFASRLGGDEDLRALAEEPLLLDPFGQLQAAVDDGHVELGSELLDEVVERVLVLGEDHELLAAILAEALRLDDIEQLDELPLGLRRLRLAAPAEAAAPAPRARPRARQRLPAATRKALSPRAPSARTRRDPRVRPRQEPRSGTPSSPGCSARGLQARARSVRVAARVFAGSHACSRRADAASSSGQTLRQLRFADWKRISASFVETKSVTAS